MAAEATFDPDAMNSQVNAISELADSLEAASETLKELRLEQDAACWSDVSDSGTYRSKLRTAVFLEAVSVGQVTDFAIDVNTALMATMAELDALDSENASRYEAQLAENEAKLEQVRYAMGTTGGYTIA